MNSISENNEVLMNLDCFDVDQIQLFMVLKHYIIIY